MGFLDKTIRRLTEKEIQNPMLAGYSMVDTCAAEFTAETPYFYANFGGDNEAAEYIANQTAGKGEWLYSAPGLSGSVRGLSLTTVVSIAPGL